ncbi:MAG TPA: carboxypeptidase regulatory-like domain-containing protein [Myxococcales bacterium]|nr:carboxypeptidase regulatory-like domain-containing protein [Myxococcales bacterium]
MRLLSLTCAALCVVGAIACANGKGDAGAPGTPGTGGTPGQPGVSSGSISGTLSYQPNPAANPLPPALPASSVDVATIPDSGVTAVTDATGAFELANVPAGVYSLRFSGNGFATLQVDGVSVIATRNIAINKVLTANNPIIVTAAVASAPAGFNAPATLSATVSGGTAPYTYKWVPAAANPTPVSLSNATAPSPTFVTGTLQAVLDSGKAVAFGKVIGFDSAGVRIFEPDSQIGFLGVSAKQLAQMTYNFTVTVTDAVGFVKSATVAVPPATLAQGNGIVPIGQIVIANIPGNASSATLQIPPGSSVTLKDAATANPWFVPDVRGNYIITAGSNTLSVQASAFQSTNPNCGGCHTVAQVPADVRVNVAAKFKDWANSAHGNHYFKYMHYDATGALVWNKDANGNPIPAPTANPTVFWNQPGAMTTFEFGMIGAEGTHYSGSCVSCHTTGYNALARNAGVDDTMSAALYAVPNLSNYFASLTGATSQQVITNGVLTTVSYDQVTAAPNFAAWDAVPASVKAFAGMQCESCHGPMNTHATAQQLPDGSMVKPVQEFSVAACAVCHDNPNNHDRVSLWRQSKHANLETAVSEGAGGTVLSTASPSASCNRCHSAQGFVQYVKQLNGQLKDSAGNPIPAYWGPLGDPGQATFAQATKAYLQGTLGITPDKVQPVTCGACHDPHTTGIRVEGNTPMLPAGFKVTGAGTGAVCFVCHNSRNGAHGDLQNGVYFTSDLPGATASTSIGAPHEASQGDVVAGKNAFFVGSYSPSAHLAVKDSCVGCHMKTFPAGLTGTNTNHTWRIDSNSCAKCHGSATAPVDGEALQTQFDDAVAELVGALNTSATATVRGLFYKGSGQTVQIPSDAVATFVFGRSVGFNLTTAGGMNDPSKTTGTINTLSAAALGSFYTDAGATTKAFDVLKGVYAKANWNYSLVTQDGSRAIHNPSFVFEVLSSTQAAVRSSAAK